MSPTNVELYEALRPTIGDEAARMIAEAWPSASDVATKADLAELRGDIVALRGELHAETAKQTRWMLAFFIPVWAGTWATTLAVLLKS